MAEEIKKNTLKTLKILAAEAQLVFFVRGGMFFKKVDNYNTVFLVGCLTVGHFRDTVGIWGKGGQENELT